MKKLLISATALSSLVVFAGAASAADFADPAYDWSGAYVGVAGGMGWGGFDSTSGPAVHQLNDFTDPLDNADGGLIGATLGFNHQVNEIVWGFETDVSWSGVSDSFVTADPEWNADLDWLVTIRPRLGFAMGRALPYVTGGLAFGGIDLEGIDNVVARSDSDSRTHFGWTIGAGVEYAVSDSVTIKAQYDYVDLGRAEHDTSGSGFTGVEDLDLGMHLARVGVNWKF